MAIPIEDFFLNIFVLEEVYVNQCRELFCNIGDHSDVEGGIKPDIFPFFFTVFALCSCLWMLYRTADLCLRALVYGVNNVGED